MKNFVVRNGVTILFVCALLCTLAGLWENVRLRDELKTLREEQQGYLDAVRYFQEELHSTYLNEVSPQQKNAAVQIKLL